MLGFYLYNRFAIRPIPVLCLVFLSIGCHPASFPPAVPGAVELRDFETFVGIEERIPATPTIIQHGGESNLFVYDAAKTSVLELDGNGTLLNEIGRQGKGPGELLRVNRIFSVQDHLYIVDYIQFLIHKYTKNGHFISSLDYASKTGRPLTPPPPASPSAVQPENIHNQPVVTLTGDVMLSSVPFSEMKPEAIYELQDWEGNHLSGIGEVPEGSSFVMDYEQLRDDVSERAVPSVYRPNAFPVIDHANPDEVFLVYSAFPVIAKYSTSGRKLWEKKGPDTPETDSLTIRFYDVMERMQRADSRSRIILSYYTAGTSSKSGDLFLAVSPPFNQTAPLYIHRFNPLGELTHRYRFKSEVPLLPIFDIDPDNNRFFIVTELGEIRAYPF